MFRKIIVCLLGIFSLCAGKYESKLNTLYDSLDPNSLSELLAFYNLYGQTEAGDKAFKRVWYLINLHRSYPISPFNTLTFPSIDLSSIVSLVTKQSYENLPDIPESSLNEIDYISSHLLNRRLKGQKVWTKAELFELPESEIDLARALLIHQYGEEGKKEIRTYEAYLDLMALQILARLPKRPTHIQLLEAINNFIFLEMGYRFPPHSMWTKDVDLYTFLPSVLDSRHGVCLGVSILYLSLAQRLGLPLKIITPPGHIYISYQSGDKIINIETTARGIHMPDETYLNINTCKLVERNLKEVIGLNFFNAAATAWHHKEHQKAIELYQEGAPYLANDRLLNIFLGYNYLFVGEVEKGTELLVKALQNPSKEDIYSDTALIDFLEGNVSVEGIQTIYQEVDETRESILKKQAEIQAILEKHPKFREGIFHLAITWLQLGRNGEALKVLDQYHTLDNNNPTVEYYLSVLSMQRLQFKKAHFHLRRLKSILKKHHHNPKALIALDRELRQTSLPL